ncbi:hypothetical protein C8J57DRAFT_1185805 [Mycena rebaudengoi]|nr:hypothetical protein C8J57DRAFT_1185805 [Mycena rebaudengoi]
MSDPHLSAKIAVIGGGETGLVTAATLLADGFTSVMVFCPEKTAGGNWARECTYPGLVTNGSYFEFRFSYEEYTQEELKMANPISGRLPAGIVSSYMERFAARHCSNCILYETKVISMARRKNRETGWDLHVKNLGTNEESIQSFDKVVVCTGAFNIPKLPSSLQDTSQFKGSVVHTADLGARYQEILDAVPVQSERTSEDVESQAQVVVVGGGKSAADAAAWFAAQGRRVTIIMSESMWHFPIPKRKLPNFLRRSRFPMMFLPIPQLRSPWERFLHNTRIGAWCLRFMYRRIEAKINKDLGLAPNSPLRPKTHIFWGGRAAGPVDVTDPHGFFAQIKSGAITLVAPARVVGYGSGGTSLLLDDGQMISAAAVVLGTGFSVSHAAFMDDAVRTEAGLKPRAPPSASTDDKMYTWMKYPVLADAPFPPSTAPLPLLFHGIVPAANWDKRDFAFNGFIRSVQNCYISECASHWIASYFRADPFLAYTGADATVHAEREAAWLRFRYPTRDCFQDREVGCNTADALANWPRFTDGLMEDMGLRSQRSGCIWGLWVFQTIDVGELKTLGAERRAKREV